MRTLKLGVAVTLTVGTGCFGCFGDNNENNPMNNTTNNPTNNGTQNNNNGTQNSNNQTVVVECSTTEPIDLSNVTEDTVLAKGEEGVCYSSGDITVSGGALLTIEPGVVILFDENAEVHVKVDGKLFAQGTASEPIVFTTEREVPGYWRGVHIERTNSIDNILDYVTIQYAGRDVEAALRITGCCGDVPLIPITNSTIEHSSSLGFFIGAATDATFEGNTVRNNATGAGYVHASELDGLSPDNDLTGNELDVIFTGGSVDGGEHTWANFGVPYRVNENIRLAAEAVVAVDPGAEFRHEEGLGWELETNTTLALNGAEGDEILLTGVEQERGFWTGITVDRSPADENIISNTIIEYAGGGGNVEAALELTSCCSTQTRFALENVTIRESETFGLVLVGVGTVVPQWDNVTLTANTSGPLKLTPGQIQYIGTGDYSGNDLDFITVTDGDINGEQYGTDHTWVNPGVPLRAENRIRVTEAAVVTMAPGTEFEFATGGIFNVMVNSGLTAIGTESEPIVFRGVDSTAGAWQGLRIERTDLMSNELDHVQISDAGGAGSDASLELSYCCSNAISVRLNNLSLSNGEKAGIAVPSIAPLTNPDNDQWFDFFDCTNITVTDHPSDVTNGTDTFTVAEFQTDICE